jgi:hypothetical protein
MISVRMLQKFFNFQFLFVAAAVLTACSLYQSGGREAIEKDSGGLVTQPGFNLKLNTHYECSTLMALPLSWQQNVTSLNEYTSLEGTKAILLAGSETPEVIVYGWVDRHVDACSLTVEDSKLSSQNLHDIVGFGEDLLRDQSTRR